MAGEGETAVSSGGQAAVVSAADRRFDTTQPETGTPSATTSNPIEELKGSPMICKTITTRIGTKNSRGETG